MKVFLRGFSFAFSGIRDTFKTELNFRFHFFAMLAAIVLGFVFALSREEWLWIGLAITLVMATELMNTGIEALADLVSTEYHPLVKKAKDASAGAVLFCSIFAIIIGASVFIPKLLILFTL